MSEQKNIKYHKIKIEKGKKPLSRKTEICRKEEQQTEPTANELMFIAWQKIYKNRYKRLF